MKSKRSFIQFLLIHFEIVTLYELYYTGNHCVIKQLQHVSLCRFHIPLRGNLNKVPMRLGLVDVYNAIVSFAFLRDLLQNCFIRSMDKMDKRRGLL